MAGMTNPSCTSKKWLDSRSTDRVWMTSLKREWFKISVVWILAMLIRIFRLLCIFKDRNSLFIRSSISHINNKDTTMTLIMATIKSNTNLSLSNIKRLKKTFKALKMMRSRYLIWNKRKGREISFGGRKLNRRIWLSRNQNKDRE